MQIIRNDSNRIVTNFTNSEFFTKSSDFNANSHYFNENLIYASQIIRDFCNSPVVVNSTLRTFLGNKNAGGAPASLHLTGEAVDLGTGDYSEAIQDDIEAMGPLYQALRNRGIGGFGIGENMIHLDTRKSGNQKDSQNGSYALWYYPPVQKKTSIVK